MHRFTSLLDTVLAPILIGVIATGHALIDFGLALFLADLVVYAVTGRVPAP